MTDPAHRLDAGAPVVAIDVGGTDTKAAAVRADGTVASVLRVRTPPAGPDAGHAVVRLAAELVQRFRDEDPGFEPAALGLLVPGEVDERAGIARYSVNLGWRDVHLRALAELETGLPVALAHDVGGAGEAEYRLGTGAAYRDVVFLAVGTGIAAALFLDGRPYRGGGLAGEIGHAPVADGPECFCGGMGCLEAVSSAGAIARRFGTRTGRTVPGAREVLELAQAGDPDAVVIWEEALDGLAIALHTVVALLDPGAIVIGGGLSEAGPALFDPLRARLEQRLTIHRPPALLRAALGEDAGVLGAALRARGVVR
jgi:glucokinase